MSSVTIAKEAREQIVFEQWEEDFENPDMEVRRVYLGSFMFLDPCGKYHHFISPNGYTPKCVNFWESLDRQLDKRGLLLECGEGDPTDMFAAQYMYKEKNDE